MENVKIKLAVLYLALEVIWLAHIGWSLFEPGMIGQVTSGTTELTPETFTVFAVVLLVGLAMAFLSLTLKDSTNRWANIIVGIVFIVLDLMIMISRLQEEKVFAYSTLLEASGVVVPAMIVWYAWKWPKQK